MTNLKWLILGVVLGVVAVTLVSATSSDSEISEIAPKCEVFNPIDKDNLVVLQTVVNYGDLAIEQYRDVIQDLIVANKSCLEGDYDTQSDYLTSALDKSKTALELEKQRSDKKALKQ